MTILCPHREEIPEDMDLYYLQGKYLQGLMKDMGKPRLHITAAARGGAITPNKRTRTWEKENHKAGLSQRRVSVKSWKDLTGMSFWTLTPRRILWDVVAIAEVIVSIVVHLSYGLSIFGCAVWIDVMSILSASNSSI
ncbi:unnamed protein product [Sphagnum troendelagicum]